VTRTRRPNSAPERRSARSAVTPTTGSTAATARSTDAGTTASSAAGTAHRSPFRWFVPRAGAGRVTTWLEDEKHFPGTSGAAEIIGDDPFKQVGGRSHRGHGGQQCIAGVLGLRERGLPCAPRERS